MKPDDRDRMITLLAEMGSAVFQDDGKAPFHLYRRKTTRTDRGKSVYIYYCQFLNKRLGIYETAQSTRQTSKAAAFTWAMARIAEGQDTRESTLTLEEFARDFFEAESPFLVYRERRGRPMGWTHRKHNAGYLNRYIVPFFKGKRLADITIIDIEAFQDWLLDRKARPGAPKAMKTLSPTTANHVVQALRLIIKWAMKKKVIAADPFVGFEPLPENPKARGTFTAEEVQRIFALDGESWPDPLARVLNMVAAVTGLRAGELQAIRRKGVEEIALSDGRTAAVISIDASWARPGRLKSPKSGKSRVVAVPPVVFRELRAIMDASPWTDPEHFVFYSVNPEAPMSYKKIDKDFARAIRGLKITPQQQRERRLSFHSWRHWCNSYLVDSGIPVLRVQQVIGHTSLKMTGNYFHTAQDFTDVLQATGRMIEGWKNGA